MSKHAPTLTPEQREHVLATVGNLKHGTRNVAMVTLSIYAGLREGEIAMLRVSDVLDDLGRLRDRIHIPGRTPTHSDQRRGKSKDARTVPLHPRASQALSRHIAEIQAHTLAPSAPLFTSGAGKPFSKVTINHAFRRFYDASGLPDHTSHSGRRTFGTELHHKGVPVKTMQVLMGHAHMSSTQIYIDTSDVLLRDAINSLT